MTMENVHAARRRREALRSLEEARAAHPGGLPKMEILQSFGESGRPKRESIGRLVLIRSVAILAIAMTVNYISIRAAFTLGYGTWWLAIPLFASDILGSIFIACMTVSLWDLDSSPPWRPVYNSEFRIAILITTYNESIEVLLPTIVGSLALSEPHETWVLDDGKRPEIAALAGELGAQYLTRDTNEHAKAGNLNNAMTKIDADIFAVLDADHVPSKYFLSNSLCYFDNPKVYQLPGTLLWQE